jgi:hypothetical protein
MMCTGCKGKIPVVTVSVLPTRQPKSQMVSKVNRKLHHAHIDATPLPLSNGTVEV